MGNIDWHQKMITDRIHITDMMDVVDYQLRVETLLSGVGDICGYLIALGVEDYPNHLHNHNPLPQLRAPRRIERPSTIICTQYRCQYNSEKTCVILCPIIQVRGEDKDTSARCLSFEQKGNT